MDELPCTPFCGQKCPRTKLFLSALWSMLPNKQETTVSFSLELTTHLVPGSKSFQRRSLQYVHHLIYPPKNLTELTTGRVGETKQKPNLNECNVQAFEKKYGYPSSISSTLVLPLDEMVDTGAFPTAIGSPSRAVNVLLTRQRESCGRVCLPN